MCSFYAQMLELLQVASGHHEVSLMSHSMWKETNESNEERSKVRASHLIFQTCSINCCE